MRYLILLSLIGSCYAVNSNISSQPIISSDSTKSHPPMIFDSRLDVVNEYDPRIRSIAMLASQRNSGIKILCSSESQRLATALSSYFKKININVELSTQADFSNKSLIKVFVLKGE